MNAAVPVWAMVASVLALFAAGAGFWVWHQRRVGERIVELAAQVLAISDGRFEQREQPPQRTLQPLAQAINVMSAQMALTLAERDEQFGALRSEVDLDPLTGLESRVPFMARLVQRLGDTSAPPGTLAILRLVDLAGLNRRFGRERGDELLRSVASLLRMRGLRLERAAEGLNGVRSEPLVLARLNGADFGLLLPALPRQDIERWLADVARALQTLPVMAGGEPTRIGWIGASRWQPGEAMGELLGRADGMLQTCESGDIDWRYTEPGQAGAMNTARWRVAIDDALETGRIGLEFQSVLQADGQEDHRHALAAIELPGGVRLEGDDLLAPATRCLRRVDIDLRVAELALESLETLGLSSGRVAIDIGWESALRPNFLLRLDGVLQRAGETARHLRVDIDMRPGRYEGLGPLAPLLELLRRHGVPAGLDCVAGPFADMTELARLGIGSLTLDAQFTAGLAAPTARGRRRMAEMLVDVARSQSLSVSARGVRDALDLQCLWEMGLTRASGPALSTSTPPVSSRSKEEASITRHPSTGADHRPTEPAELA